MPTAKRGVFYAQLDRNPGREALHAWLAETYGLLDVLVEVREGSAEEGVAEPRPPYGEPPVAAGIERRSNDDFPFQLTICSPWVRDPWRELAALCRHFRCRALGDDETVNPSTAMLMDENGESWWVALDGEALDDPVEERQVIAGACTEPEGSLLLTAPADVPALRGPLAEALAVAPDQLELEAYTYDLSPLDRVGFDSHYPLIRGQHFRHGVRVTVSRAQRKWEPMDDALRTWINQVTPVAQRLQTRLCLTHRALQFVSYPKERDFEHHCYYWDGEGLQRFTYKDRRMEP